MLEALALDGKGESTVFGDAKGWTPAVAHCSTARSAIRSISTIPRGFVAASERAGGAGRVRGRRTGRRVGPRRAHRDRGRL